MNTDIKQCPGDHQAFYCPDCAQSWSWNELIALGYMPEALTTEVDCPGDGEQSCRHIQTAYDPDLDREIEIVGPNRLSAADHLEVCEFEQGGDDDDE